jgi:hypothetical protein
MLSPILVEVRGHLGEAIVLFTCLVLQLLRAATKRRNKGSEHETLRREINEEKSFNKAKNLTSKSWNDRPPWSQNALVRAALREAPRARNSYHSACSARALSSRACGTQGDTAPAPTVMRWRQMLAARRGMSMPRCRVLATATSDNPQTPPPAPRVQAWGLARMTSSIGPS